MAVLARHLTDYVIRKGIVNETDRKIYEYGFVLFSEVGLFVMFCLIATVYLHMYVEGVFFFLVFAPLRSYAGGLHLEKFWSCFILSCLTFSIVLLLIKSIHMPPTALFFLLLLLELAVYGQYPVESPNRTVDQEEDRYFRRKLRRFLWIDFMVGVLCLLTGLDVYLQEMVLIFLIVAVTMLMGKIKNRKSQHM